MAMSQGQAIPQARPAASVHQEPAVDLKVLSIEWVEVSFG